MRRKEAKKKKSQNLEAKKGIRSRVKNNKEEEKKSKVKKASRGAKKGGKNEEKERRNEQRRSKDQIVFSHVQKFFPHFGEIVIW